MSIFWPKKAKNGISTGLNWPFSALQGVFRPRSCELVGNGNEFRDSTAEDSDPLAICMPLKSHDFMLLKNVCRC